MIDQQIPQHVRRFIAEFIESVVQLEVLLLLYGLPSHSYTFSDVARELRISPDWAQKQLATLKAQQLLELDVAAAGSGEPQRYRFAPASPELVEAVHGLAAAYENYRVTVTTLIFAKPTDQLRSFADAFQLRKPPSDG